MRFRRLNLTQNCQHFLTQKPPLVTFCLVLLCFLFVLIDLIIYLNTHDVRNQDINDWNSFKESLASLEYCLSVPIKENLTEFYDLNKLSLSHERYSYSFEVIFNIEYKKELLDLTKLYGQIALHEIGLQNDFSSQDILFLNYDLIHSPRNEQAFLTRLQSDFCIQNPTHRDCTYLRVKACVTLNGPSYTFPKTRTPQTCYVQYDDSKVHQKTIITANKETPDLPLHQFWCSTNEGLKAKMLYKIDPNLFEMLTNADKKLITFHLVTCVGLVIIFLVAILLKETIKMDGKRLNSNAYKPVIDESI